MYTRIHPRPFYCLVRKLEGLSSRLHGEIFRSFAIDFSARFEGRYIAHCV